MESLDAFARAIYALGLADGRCTGPSVSDARGFYDPQGVYANPPRGTIAYTGEPVTYAAADQAISPGIKSSFGIDLVDVFVDVGLDLAAGGRPVVIEFHPGPVAGARFHLQLWRSIDPGTGDRPRPLSRPEVLVPTGTGTDGRLLYTIPPLDAQAPDRLGLIITRVDAGEGADPVGAYTLVVRGEGS